MTVTSHLLQSWAWSSVPLTMRHPGQVTLEEGDWLIPSQKDKSRALIDNFSFFSLSLIPATRSCHHGLLRSRSGAGGPGRDVLQQLLPLPALAGSPERRHGPGAVGAQREAGPGASWQPVQLGAGGEDASRARAPARHRCQRRPLPLSVPGASSSSNAYPQA